MLLPPAEATSAPEARADVFDRFIVDPTPKSDAASGPASPDGDQRRDEVASESDGDGESTEDKPVDIFLPFIAGAGGNPAATEPETPFVEETSTLSSGDDPSVALGLSLSDPVDTSGAPIGATRAIGETASLDQPVANSASDQTGGSWLPPWATTMDGISSYLAGSYAGSVDAVSGLVGDNQGGVLGRWKNGFWIPEGHTAADFGLDGRPGSEQFDDTARELLGENFVEPAFETGRRQEALTNLPGAAEAADLNEAKEAYEAGDYRRVMLITGLAVLPGRVANAEMALDAMRRKFGRKVDDLLDEQIDLSAAPQKKPEIFATPEAADGFARNMPTIGEAKKAYKKNREFREWFHREYKPDVKTGPSGHHNPDLADEQMQDAYGEYLDEAEWRTNGPNATPAAPTGDDGQPEVNATPGPAYEPVATSEAGVVDGPREAPPVYPSPVDPNTPDGSGQSRQVTGTPLADLGTTRRANGSTKVSGATVVSPPEFSQIEMIRDFDQEVLAGLTEPEQVTMAFLDAIDEVKAMESGDFVVIGSGSLDGGIDGRVRGALGKTPPVYDAAYLAKRHGVPQNQILKTVTEGGSSDLSLHAFVHIDPATGHVRILSMKFKRGR